MASPIAHAMAGWSLYLMCRPERLRWQDLLVAATLTVLADFDLIALAFVGSEGHYWHHTFTHAVLFGPLMGLLALAVSRLRRGQADVREAGLVAMLVASHVVVDYYTVDHSFPYGIPLWWPVSVEFYGAEQPVFLNIQRGSWRALFGEHNIRAMVLELVVMAPILALAALVYRARAGRGARRSETN